MLSGPTIFPDGGGCFLKIGPIAKPSAGSAKAAAATPPAPWAVAVMKRRRVIVSPSKAPGIFRSSGVFGLVLDALVGHVRLNNIEAGFSVGAEGGPGVCAHRL